MDLNQTEPWIRRPGPSIAAGVGLLAMCAGFAFLWFTTDVLLARPLGLLTGSVGIYLVYGGVVGLKEER